MIDNKKTSAADVVKKTNRTVSGILWGKFLDTIEESTWSTIFWTIIKMASSITLAILLVHGKESIHIVMAWAKWNEYMIPKISTSIALSFGWRIWKSIGIWIWDEISESIMRSIDSIRPDVPTWYGIPVAELVDHIFETQCFRRDDVEARFALPRNRFDEMAKKMDEVKIFARGENNARILNTEYSRSDISSMLMAASETGELRQLIRRDGEGSFTHQPSMPDILKKTDTTPPSETGFVISEIPKIAS